LISRFFQQIVIRWMAAALGIGVAACSVVSAAAAAGDAVMEGQRLTLVAEVGEGEGPFTYSWFKDGAPLRDAVHSRLEFAAVRPGDAGVYAVVVTNAGGSTASPPELITVVRTGRGRLGNASIVAGSGESLLVGFALGGGGASAVQRWLARAAGPALVALGVESVLADPMLAIFERERLIAANDDWDGSVLLAKAAAAAGAFPFSAGSRDAAIVADLPASNYTMRVQDGAGGTGTVVVELYEGPRDDETIPPRLMNLSARGLAGEGSGGLAVGFAVTGEAPLTVLVRGVGPGLERFGVNGVLRDPRLSLFRTTFQMAMNNDWSEQLPGRLSVAAKQVGAFALADGSRDAALLVTLEPGSYSAQVTGGPQDRGWALIELYELP
jgi:hypothetical protein